MKLFDKTGATALVLKNKNEYVRLAAVDLAKDFARVSRSCIMPEIRDLGEGIVIAENSRPDIDPALDESFSIVCDGDKVVISAPTHLGTLWGIYTFSERILGVHPTFLWDDIEIAKKEQLEIPPFEICEKPDGFGFRGIFINDEDLLTGWKISGGRREINYPWYNDTVDVSIMDRVVETVLRLRLNLVIPASFLDLANPPERALADAVAKRGIYLSQHHVEPVGLSTFTFEKYLEKYNKQGEFSYIKNPELMEEIWRHYAELWAQYDHVVWQIGLRGKIDSPVWEAETPTREERRHYAKFISSALEKQKEIVLEATGGKAKHFTSTLWMEGAELMKDGFLTLPDGAISVFADIGPNQMYSNDFYDVKREADRRYGIYYHVQYFGLGPHLAPLTGLRKLHYNLKLAYDMGDRDYIILNASNIREFTFELGAYSRMTWSMNAFSEEEYLDSYASCFADSKEAVKKAVTDYFDAIAVLDTSLLGIHNGNVFDYRYEDVDGIKNLAVKDGMVVNVCRNILSGIKHQISRPFWTDYYRAVCDHEPEFSAVCAAFEGIAQDMPSEMRAGILCHWAVYAKTMDTLYTCMMRIYEARETQEKGSDSECLSLLCNARDCLKSLFEYRRIAEKGDFENWY